MSKKSNEYGYVPQSPAQLDAENTGIFEANDVVSLITDNKWSTSSQLVEIETKTIYSADASQKIEFDDIKENVFENHLLWINNLKILNNSVTPRFRVKVGGTIDTGNNYSYMENWGDQTVNSAWTYSGQTASTSGISYGVSPNNSQGSNCSAVWLIGNAGNPNTHTTFTSLFSGTMRFDNEYHGIFTGVYHNTAAVNGILLDSFSATNIYYGKMTLFGIR
jgi:hypothetical protein